MDASLPALTLAAESPSGLPGLEGNIQLKQLGSESSRDFGALMAQLQTGLSGAHSADLPPLADAEFLARELQSLPEGGKLLPLLQQVLEAAPRHHAGPRQVMDRIAAKLEHLQLNPEQNPAEVIAASLYQVLQEIPGTPTVAAPKLAPMELQNAGIGDGPRQGREVPGRSPAQLIQGPPDIRHTGEEPATPEAVAKDLKGSGLEKSLGPLPQLTSAPEQRQAELASAMAALKRVVAEARPRPGGTESTVSKPDSVAIAVTPASHQPTSPATSALPSINLETPFTQGNWDKAMGERIQWMVSQKMQGAQIRLNPANLGPLEVRIQVLNDQASVQFNSTHPIVREALEAALPRLRDMFDASGVELVDVDVSGQSFAEQQQAADHGEAAAWAAPVSTENVEPEMLLETPLSAIMENGQLDLFV